MTKKDLIKAIRGMPDNAEIVLAYDMYHKCFKNCFRLANLVLLEKRSRIKKIVIATNPLKTIEKDKLLSESKIVYWEH